MIFNTKVLEYLKDQAAISLVEVILAIALLGIIISGMAGIFVYGEQSSIISGNHQRASLLLDEGLEVIKNLKSDNFPSLGDGMYGLEIQTDNTWALVGSPDVTDNFFTRAIEISTIDATTREINITVSWDGQYQSALISGETYVTNWEREILITENTPGMLVYADLSGEDDTIRYKLLDDTGTWGSELTVPDFNVPRNRDAHNVQLYSSPTRDEKILVVRFASNGPGADTYIYAAVWDGLVWGNVISLSSWNGTDNSHTRNFDGSYRNDGTFIVAFSNDSDTVRYRTWNGSAWSSQSNGPDINATPQWITLATDPGGGSPGSETLIMIRDDDRDINVSSYNGSSWSPPDQLASDGEDDSYEQMSFDFSGPLNIGMIMFNEDSDSTPNLYNWFYFFGWWLNDESLSFGGDLLNMRIIGRPGVYEYIGCALDDDNDINCAETGFIPSFSSLSPLELENNAESGKQSSFDLSYENSGELALIVYSGNPDQEIPKYRTFDPSTNSWSSEQAHGDVGNDIETVKLLRDPYGEDIIAILGTTAQDVYTLVWDGENDTFYTAGGYALTSHGLEGSDDDDFWFDFEWDMHL